MSKIEFSDHAKRALKERKIPKSRIYAAIRNPDKVKSSFRDRRLQQKKFGDTILEVVVIVEKSKTIIITQYYLGVQDEITLRSKN